MKKKLLVTLSLLCFAVLHDTSFAAKQKTPPPPKAKLSKNNKKKILCSICSKECSHINIVYFKSEQRRQVTHHLLLCDTCFQNVPAKKENACQTCKNIDGKNSFARLCSTCFKCTKCRKSWNHDQAISYIFTNEEKTMFCNTCNYPCNHCKLAYTQEETHPFLDTDGSTIKFRCTMCKDVLSLAKSFKN